MRQGSLAAAAADGFDLLAAAAAARLSRRMSQVSLLLGTLVDGGSTYTAKQLKETISKTFFLVLDMPV